MGVLPDHKIARELAYGELEVEPVNLDEQLQPASLDIRLGNHFREFRDNRAIVGLDDDLNDEMFETTCTEIVLAPDDFVLADTVETFKIPNNILGRVTGRSSIGRLGVTVHQTAGLFDPGFQGKGVLEIANATQRPIVLESGMRIAQMTFEKIEGSANKPYSKEDNKYQEQDGPVPSRIHEDIS